ncbi:leucine-rich repeat protein [Butyrivibrio sp. FC2001]|uniref:leucine-rich repeat protein n=1 Tax=Butyrivibrio sp. FC2001 TaxID=1280671 RepID=UPI000413186E|nr:leucine-rich repeat protein [Butyrivibrio sp. FC2001]
MKKSIKIGACKVITTIACATFVFAGALGINSLSAKAAVNKTWSIDLSNGKTYTYNEKVFEEANPPKEERDAFALAAIVETYTLDIATMKQPEIGAEVTAEFSKNPYQGVLLNFIDEDNVSIKGANGAIGTGKYVVSADSLMKAGWDRWSACYCIQEVLAVLYGEKVEYDYVRNNNVEIVVDVNFSDLPIITTNNGLGTSAVSFIVNKEFEADSIRYRVLGAAGNLSAIKLTEDKKKVTIPDSVNLNGYNLNVIDIAPNFMKGNKKTKTVTIGSNVTSIGSKAFYQCKKLKKVTIKSTKLTTIGKKAFGKDAKKFKLKLPKSCKKTYKKLLKKAGYKL